MLNKAFLHDAERFLADPIADKTVAKIVGAWPKDLAAHDTAPQWQNMAALGKAIAATAKLTNGELENWKGNVPMLSREGHEALAALYHDVWKSVQGADHHKLERAGEIARKNGAVYSAALFTASQPIVYSIPSISATLISTKVSAEQTARRIKGTSELVLPVILKGGMTAEDGRGLAMIARARLFHAAARNLILRGEPEMILKEVGEHGILVPTTSGPKIHEPYRSMHDSGYNIAKFGMPIHQRDMGTVIQTFAYTPLRVMRQLGMGLQKYPHDEEAFMYAWNTVGKGIGLRGEQMAWTYHEAEQMFHDRLKASHAEAPGYEPCKLHGQKHMEAMKTAFPGMQGHVPEQLMFRLCSDETLHMLGFNKKERPLTPVFHHALNIARVGEQLSRKFDMPFHPHISVLKRMGLTFADRILGLPPEKLHALAPDVNQGLRRGR